MWSGRVAAPAACKRAVVATAAAGNGGRPEPGARAAANGCGGAAGKFDPDTPLFPLTKVPWGADSGVPRRICWKTDFDITIANVRKSTADHGPLSQQGVPSWLGAWREACNEAGLRQLRARSRCAVCVGAGDGAGDGAGKGERGMMHGGHVWVEGLPFGRVVAIVPLCPHHNTGKEFAFPAAMVAPAGTVLMLMPAHAVYEGASGAGSFCLGAEGYGAKHPLELGPQ
ncbi:MAG: hypothetical protein J3K34DRAFT_515967 [Monoraphidium minutum]|nr:MAG: hypothetical protein J3K34DRAFT_515967 [Monoraphidium minutum]